MKNTTLASDVIRQAKKSARIAWAVAAAAIIVSSIVIRRHRDD